MKDQDIKLGVKEQDRIQVLSLLGCGEITLEQAQRSLKCSERSLYLWMKKLRDKGPLGLIHGNRGKESPRKLNESIARTILRLKREQYFDFNDIHFKEYLEHEHKISIGRESLRVLLRSHQIKPKQKRRRPRSYMRRERKSAYGMMIQIDASTEYWLGDLRPKLCLLGGIDDASNKVWAVFDDVECTYGYFDMMREIINQEGVPMSLYSDRHTIFHSPDVLTVQEQMKGSISSTTQFGRAMKELGVEMIKAYTPQAKGRIERLWRTFQDRLIAEMRLKGLSSKEEAQEYLKGFLKRYNEQFSVKPKSKETCFRKAPPKAIIDDILCLKEQRKVCKNHTVKYHGHLIDIKKPKGWKNYALKVVDVLERQDGKIKIVYNEQVIASYHPKEIEDILSRVA